MHEFGQWMTFWTSAGCHNTAGFQFFYLFYLLGIKSCSTIPTQHSHHNNFYYRLIVHIEKKDKTNKKTEKKKIKAKKKTNKRGKKNKKKQIRFVDVLPI